MKSIPLTHIPPEIEEHTLLTVLSSKLTKAAVIQLAEQVMESDNSITRLHDACYTETPQVSFRASWVLEHIALEKPNEFIPVFKDFFTRLPLQDNPSCQRCFTKMIMMISHPKAPLVYKQAFQDVDKDSLVTTIFEWLVDEQTPVATRVNCFDVLFNLRDQVDWISDELKNQIEFFMPGGSAALRSRGQRILKKL